MNISNKAFDFELLALYVSEKIGDKFKLAVSRYNIGVRYFNKSDYNSTLEYLDVFLLEEFDFQRWDKIEVLVYQLLSYKYLGKEYDLNELYSMINENNNYIFKINYRLFQLLENTSYLKTAYNQIQEKADNLEPDVAAKFLSYPIPKAIVEEWEKVK